jgi:hypothetical protein
MNDAVGERQQRIEKIANSIQFSTDRAELPVKRIRLFLNLLLSLLTQDSPTVS